MIASNRINTPEVAERILPGGDGRSLSMARPWLADADFMAKTRAGRASEEINVCIACNQACLDLIFSERAATCLVNPKAGRELEFDVPKARDAQARCRRRRWGSRSRLRDRGGGAGTRCEVFEAAERIGGQLNLARNVPGKEEFDETLRYFGRP